MKISQKRKEKKERKERLYRPRSAGERAAGRRAVLYGAVTLLLCIMLIVGAVLSFLFMEDAETEETAHSTEPQTESYRYTVIIDPGHGGTDMGDIVNDETYECDLTIALASEISALLEEENCEVIFTRTIATEEALTDEERIKNVTEGDCMISLHTCVDKGVYYSFLSDTTESSKHLAEYFGPPTQEGEHIITRPASIPCVLLGIDESTEAQAIADGIMDYLTRFVK